MIKENLYYWWKIQIVDRYYTFISWCKYHFTKDFYRVMKTCLVSYPWDYSFLYDLEETKLKEMINYHENHHRICSEQREQIIRSMKLAVKMLEIIRNDTKYFSYNGQMQFTELKKTDENGNKLYTAEMDGLIYHCLVYVNTKNYKRFNVSDCVVKLHPHELYIEKARYLYHKIRYNYEQYWWD